MMYSDEIRSSWSTDSPRALDEVGEAERKSKGFPLSSQYLCPQSAAQTLGEAAPQSFEEQFYWEGHRNRLRLRLEKEGWNALRPHEMVELALYHAIPRQDVTELARALVERFGSVGDVFGADRAALEAVPGMTYAAAEWIALTGELMRAYFDLREDAGARLSCYGDVLNYLDRQPVGDARCGMWALYMDSGFSLITYSYIGGPVAWMSAENARRLVRECVSSETRYMIFLRVMDEPLRADEEELSHLEALSHTMQAINVDILDCVLTDGDASLSMNKARLLERAFAESKNMALFERYAQDDS